MTAGPANGNFFGGTTGASIWVSKDYRKATQRGTGQAKTSGDYAASMLASKEAYANGCGKVLFLDAQTARYVGELFGECGGPTPPGRSRARGARRGTMST